VARLEWVPLATGTRIVSNDLDSHPIPFPRLAVHSFINGKRIGRWVTGSLGDQDHWIREMGVQMPIPFYYILYRPLLYTTRGKPFLRHARKSNTKSRTSRLVTPYMRPYWRPNDRRLCRHINSSVSPFRPP